MNLTIFRAGIAIFGLSFSLLTVGCRDSTPSSQEALRKLGYHFTAEDFLRAAEAGDQAAVDQFIEYEMPIEMAGPNGDTALILAATAGHTGLALSLIEQGAEIDRPGRYERTALLRASENGHADTIKLFLDANANPNHEDAKGWTALTLAVYDGHVSATRRLAPVSKAQLDSAILVAAIQGSPETVEILIEAGAILETRNSSGHTPLMLAARNGHVAAAEKLIRRGANPFAQDSMGATASDFANERGHERVTALFSLVPEHLTEQSARSEPRLLIAQGEPALATPLTSLTPVSAQAAARPKLTPIGPLAGENRPLIEGKLFDIAPDLSDDYLSEFFELRNFVDDPLPLSLVSAQIGQATVRVLYGDAQPQTVHVGHMIADTGFQTLSITPRLVRTSDGGPMIDASEVVVRQANSGQQHTLVSGTSAQGSGAFAVLGYQESGATEFDARRGDEFRIRRAGVSLTYRVTAVGPAQVILENLKSHQIINIRRQDKPTDRF